MDDLELVRRKKKKKLEVGSEQGIFGELDVDMDSDHPVHEEFVNERGLREIKRRSRKI